MLSRLFLASLLTLASAAVLAACSDPLDDKTGAAVADTIEANSSTGIEVVETDPAPTEDVFSKHAEGSKPKSDAK